MKYSTKEDKAYTINDIFRSYNNVYRQTLTLIQTFSSSFISWTALRSSRVWYIMRWKPASLEYCNLLSTCALFYSMETMTPASTNLASWLRRSFCQREWVTAECTQHSIAKIFTHCLFYRHVYLCDSSTHNVLPACSHGCVCCRW